MLRSMPHVEYYAILARFLFIDDGPYAFTDSRRDPLRDQS